MVGKISPYTSNCKNVGRTDGAAAQFVDDPNRDQSEIPTPEAKTHAAEDRNNVVRTVLALEAKEMPDFGPKTIAAMENADMIHPIA